MSIQRSHLALSFVLLAVAAVLISVIANAQADKTSPSGDAALSELSTSNEAFEKWFEVGDELSEQKFEAKDGVGINVGEGRRFTRFPRADLTGAGEWATHFPTREGGANATSCVACHNSPIANGAGDVAVNVIVDPAHTGDPTKYLERNTLPIVALGPVQRVAEEISQTLADQRMTLAREACARGHGKIHLQAKTISFGILSANKIKDSPCVVEVDYGEIQGVDDDLIIKAFGWKGNKATIRDFTRGAAHNELGLQAVEMVGDKDGDYDGVVNELSVDDLTALTIYMAALERPVSKVELNNLGILELNKSQLMEIDAGEDAFERADCTSCHTPQLPIYQPTFSEPSNTPGFFDVAFPDGSNPADHGLTTELAVKFDVTKDQPNNKIKNKDGKEIMLGAVPVNQDGVAMIQWFSDFKRHDMGPELADPDDPLGIGAQMWLTRSLAGVGSTGPWLHDGRATTLEEAILAHGGDASESRGKYAALTPKEQQQLIAFLENMLIYKSDEDDH